MKYNAVLQTKSISNSLKFHPRTELILSKDSEKSLADEFLRKSVTTGNMFTSLTGTNKHN